MSFMSNHLIAMRMLFTLSKTLPTVLFMFFSMDLLISFYKGRILDGFTIEPSSRIAKEFDFGFCDGKF